MKISSGYRDATANARTEMRMGMSAHNPNAQYGIPVPFRETVRVVRVMTQFHAEFNAACARAAALVTINMYEATGQAYQVVTGADGVTRVRPVGPKPPLLVQLEALRHEINRREDEAFLYGEGGPTPEQLRELEEPHG